MKSIVHVAYATELNDGEVEIDIIGVFADDAAAMKAADNYTKAMRRKYRRKLCHWCGTTGVKMSVITGSLKEDSDEDIEGEPSGVIGEEAFQRLMANIENPPPANEKLKQMIREASARTKGV